MALSIAKVCPGAPGGQLALPAASSSSSRNNSCNMQAQDCSCAAWCDPARLAQTNQFHTAVAWLSLPARMHQERFGVQPALLDPASYCALRIGPWAELRGIQVQRAAKGGTCPRCSLPGLAAALLCSCSHRLTKPLALAFSAAAAQVFHGQVVRIKRSRVAEIAVTATGATPKACCPNALVASDSALPHFWKLGGGLQQCPHVAASGPLHFHASARAGPGQQGTISSLHFQQRRSSEVKVPPRALSCIHAIKQRSCFLSKG